MRISVEIGAPSLAKRGANEVVSEAFKDVEFPLDVEFKNFMPRNVSFPEIEGLYLKHVAALEGTKITLRVNNFDQLQRLTSSVEAIAELNKYNPAMGFSFNKADPVESDETNAEAEAEAKTEAKAEAKEEAEVKAATKRTTRRKTTA
ncbi:hypothetical protein [uncultured Parasutterella sp.]|uniref:hypothetical protein n=1 Tax=uncultured Parasutterella sp. TaxID=1263098 RepID=UPI002591F313|nr:hypothetical protein [uncultured Parasutterella sp.]